MSGTMDAEYKVLAFPTTEFQGSSDSTFIYFPTGDTIFYNYKLQRIIKV